MTAGGRCGIGIDLGTSGARLAAVDASGEPLFELRRPLPPPHHPGEGQYQQDPEPWWRAVRALLGEAAGLLPQEMRIGLTVDATSGSVLLTDRAGRPLTPALLYNDTRGARRLGALRRLAPDHPALAPSGTVGRVLALALRAPLAKARILHQADWILGRLCGRWGLSDDNNALKLGFDAATRRWPAWLATAGIPAGALPRVERPGTPLGRLRPELAAATGLPPTTEICAGTTDSTAAAIAAGLRRPGDAMTSLGSTLVVKVVAERPVEAAALGVYSHRFGDHWLVGGASNSGGAVLLRSFDAATIVRLSQAIDPERPSGLDYYPLPAPGERFPVNDPGLAPRLEPRPADDRLFLQGVFEGIARIEAAGYRELNRLGAPLPERVVTTGGGAGNRAWRRIRERLLGLPVSDAGDRSAACGAALLALHHGVPAA